jgi:hypothetical protein
MEYLSIYYRVPGIIMSTYAYHFSLELYIAFPNVSNPIVLV